MSGSRIRSRDEIGLDIFNVGDRTCFISPSSSKIQELPLTEEAADTALAHITDIAEFQFWKNLLVSDAWVTSGALQNVIADLFSG